MSNVRSVGGPGAAVAVDPGARPAEASGEGTFREILRDSARSITQGQRQVDSVIVAARRGRVFSQEELIAVQAGVYRYAQELELASKLVDKASTAVKTTLQSQQ
jgi:hypothetical protein